MDKYKELLKDQKKERVKFMQKDKLKESILKKTKIPFSIYLSNLFGSSGSIKFKDLFREENLNKKELKQLLNKFKPIKMFMVKDGCLSFRCSEDINAKNTLINPYIIKYEGMHNYNDKIIIKWYTKINGLIYEIEAYINNFEFINEIAKRDYNTIEFSGGYRVDDVRLILKGNFVNSEYEFIKWASGSNENPNDFTIYTENLNLNIKEFLNL